MEPAIDQVILGWLDSLRNRFSGDGRQTCDMGQKIQFLTVDIITRICLGEELGCVENDCDMYRLLETVETGNQIGQYASVFLEINTLFSRLARIPVLRKILVPKPSDATGVGRLISVHSTPVCCLLGMTDRRR